VHCWYVLRDGRKSYFQPLKTSYQAKIQRKLEREVFVMKKKPSKTFAVIAMISGIAALPVAAFVNMMLGLAMLTLPVLLVYQASEAPHK
jgi:hypothetical protein